MNSEYNSHFGWAYGDEGYYTRENQNNGFISPKNIEYNEVNENRRQTRKSPNSEEALALRMLRNDNYLPKLVKSKTENSNQFTTTYREAFKEEENYLPPISTYRKAAEKYASDFVNIQNDMDAGRICNRTVSRQVRENIHSQGDNTKDDILETSELVAAVLKDPSIRSNPWNVLDHRSHCSLQSSQDQNYRAYKEHLERKIKKPSFQYKLLNSIYSKEKY